MKYQHDIESQAITSICSDPKSKTLMAGTNANTFIMFQLNNGKAMDKMFQTPTVFETNVFAIKLIKNEVGNNMYLAGLANGLIKIFDCANGNVLVDLQAHSRGVNSIAVHRTKPIFATCSDDTMVNLWQVDFQKSEDQPIGDLKIVLSQKISDQLLMGISFGDNENLLVAPYDYKYLIHVKSHM